MNHFAGVRVKNFSSFSLRCDNFNGFHENISNNGDSQEQESKEHEISKSQKSLWQESSTWNEDHTTKAVISFDVTVIVLFNPPLFSLDVSVVFVVFVLPIELRDGGISRSILFEISTSSIVSDFSVSFIVLSVNTPHLFNHRVSGVLGDVVDN